MKFELHMPDRAQWSVFGLLLLITTANMLPYALEPANGSAYITYLIPALPTVLGVSLIFLPKSYAVWLALLLATVISAAGLTVYFVRGASMQTGIIVVLMYGIQGAALTITSIIEWGRHGQAIRNQNANQAR